MKSYTLLLILLIATLGSFSQENATLTGRIIDENNLPVSDANVQIIDTKAGTVSDVNGRFSITLKAKEKVTIKFSHAKYWSTRKTYVFAPNEIKNITVIMLTPTLQSVDITAVDPGTGSIDKYDVIPPSQIVSPNASVESTLRYGNYGISQNNELSAGYNVRGGNYNENLIYVNDIQVYRPFLARSGQQEGLSFINPYLVGSILFSAGGFDAKYGDKLSSVLDIKYTEATSPGEFHGSFTSSLLGASAHIQQNVSSRFNYITGLRYRTNSYLLGSLDTKGEYKPTFIDYQGMFNYNLNEKTKLSFLGTYSRNRYRVIPSDRETNFGSINEALRFTVYYDGQETTEFETYMAALALESKPNENLTLKYITSVYQTHESEKFDLLGEYKLDELERDLGNDQYGDVAFNRGVGSFLNHARNNLDATIANVYHKGNWKKGTHNVNWGVKYQYEIINDQIKEWNYIDSSRFNIPHPSDSIGYTDPSAQPYQYLTLSNLIKAKNELKNSRFTSYIQDKKRFEMPVTLFFSDSVITKDTAYLYTDTISTSRFLTATAGIRTHWWEFNQQFIVSPRASVKFFPAWYYLRDGKLYRRNINFRFSTGFYYQPPFYRAARNIQGDVNPSIRAQKSIHFVFGTDYTFYMWNRPFKFGTELYYKHLADIIPYEIDNVRIRYLGTNNAKGYAAGIDMKINGQFINGIESYASLSYMKTEEDILDDYYLKNYNSDGEEIINGYTSNTTVVTTDTIQPGYVPRPTDQRVSFALFFQDQMPEEWNTPKIKWSTFKVNLTMVFGSRLPYGPPGTERYKDTLRSSFYKRVDIGFSKELLSNKSKYKEGSIWKKMDRMWLSLEVFNLLDISNTINYSWIKDVTGRQYAIPSFLTSRRLNLKFVVQF